MTKGLLGLALLSSLLLSSYSWAATSTTTLGITANVISVCISLTATSLAFGNYDPTSATSTDNTNTFSVRCTLDNSYSIALNGGTTSGGTVSLRKMTDGSDTLNYNLYTSTGRSTIWGDGTGGTSTVAGTGTGLTQNYTIYGRASAQQTSPAGSYSDIITITVTY